MVNTVLKILFRSLRRPIQKRRRQVLNTLGDHYNLHEVFQSVNARYFESKLELHITWFGSKNSVPKRRLTLGTYNHQAGLIKIHRLLDQAHIPNHVVSYVVYHEMLHHVLPPIKKKWQKRQIHHAAFKAREKQFQEYALIKEFQKTLRETGFRSLSMPG
jgi:hypothetical protein